MKFYYAFLLLLLPFLNRAQFHSIEITVIDATNKSAISDATVSIGNLSAFTNELGTVIIKCQEDVENLQICIHSLGYVDTCFNNRVQSEIVAELKERSLLLLEAEVLGTSNNLAYNRLEESVLKSKVLASELKEKGLVLGEMDIIKGLQFLPGVQEGNPGSSELMVRGGSHYQNQFLIEGIPIYSTGHLYGATSAFPPTAIRNATIIKEAFPVEYNYMASSVVDIELNDPNLKKWAGGLTFGIGAISGDINIPLKHSAIQVAARATTLLPITYLSSINSQSSSKEIISFWDVIARYKISLKKGTLDWIWIQNQDYFSRTIADPSGVERSDENKLRSANLAGGLNYKRQLQKNLLLHTKLYYSVYQYNYFNKEFNSQSSTYNKFQELQYKAATSLWGGKTLLNWFYSPNLQLKWGVDLNMNIYQYPSYSFINKIRKINISPNSSPSPIYLVDASPFTEVKFYLANRWILNLGLRYQLHQMKDGNQHFVLPRYVIKHMFSEKWATFLSYDRFSQSFHRLRENNTLSAQDFSIIPENRLPVEVTSQWAIGGVFSMPKFEFQLQLYYRDLQNFIDRDYRYTAFATSIYDDLTGNILSDPSISLVKVDGTAYGLETGMQLRIWRLKWALTYNYSISNRISNELNRGIAYPSLFNRKHSFRTNASIKFKGTKIGKVIQLGLSWFYGSGFYTQFPMEFQKPPNVYGINRPSLSYIPERHNAQLPPLHHLDIVISTIKETQKGIRTFSLSIYNAYLAPVSSYYTYQGSTLKTQGYLPIVPALNYTYQWK